MLSLCRLIVPLGATILLIAPDSAPAQQLETIQELAGRLPPDQKQQLQQALQSFGAQKYAEALVVFKQLLSGGQHDDPVLAKLASEAALNTGDTAFATATLKPVAAANPDDWQATALLARACAEAGDKAGRDANMTRMQSLYAKGMLPPRMQNYILERVRIGDAVLLIRPSLEPWGPYKVYDLGQVFDKTGVTVLRITLESPDFDQGLFARDHPQQAALGLRQFSFDGYRGTPPGANGRATQEHFTYKFVTGQPNYDTVREEFIQIMKGQVKPFSSRTGLAVQ